MASRRSEGTIWDRFRKKPWGEQKVTLDTYTRRTYIDGAGVERMEYVCTSEEITNSDRPKSAVHQTGKKGRVALVSMEPDFPVFDEYDDQGNPLPDHNVFDAQGYDIYARDDRLEKAEAALDYKAKGREMPIEKVITLLAVAVVVVAVVAWFFLRRWHGEAFEA